MKHYRRKKTFKIEDPISGDYTSDIDKALAKDPNRLYTDKFYDLSLEEMEKVARGIQKEYMAAEDEFKSAADMPADGEEGSEPEQHELEEIPEAHNDPLNWLCDELNELMPLAVFYRKDVRRYMHAITCARTICTLVQDADPEAMFRVYTEPLLGKDLVLSVYSDNIEIDQMPMFLQALSGASSFYMYPTDTDRILWEIFFEDVYKAVGEVKNR